MGDHSRKSGERRQMVPNKSISFSHLALIVILVIVNAFTTYASPLEPYKRGRSASSSLIPFPRVGRSVSEPLQSIESDPNDEMLAQRSSRSTNSQFYGQKRTVQKRQALIPFPRTGKRASIQPHKYQDDALGQKLVALISAMEGDSERFVYPREFETLQLIQSLLRELQNDK